MYYFNVIWTNASFAWAVTPAVSGRGQNHELDTVFRFCQDSEKNDSVIPVVEVLENYFA